MHAGNAHMCEATAERWANVRLSWASVERSGPIGGYRHQIQTGCLYACVPAPRLYSHMYTVTLCEYTPLRIYTLYHWGHTWAGEIIYHSPHLPPPPRMPSSAAVTKITITGHHDPLWHKNCQQGDRQQNINSFVIDKFVDRHVFEAERCTCY